MIKLKSYIFLNALFIWVNWFSFILNWRPLFDVQVGGSIFIINFPNGTLSAWPVKVIVLGWTMRMHEFARDIFIFQINFVNKNYPPVTIEQARCVVVGLKGLLHLLWWRHRGESMVSDHVAFVITELFSFNRCSWCWLKMMTAASTWNRVSISIYRFSILFRTATISSL